ncbi:MAG TPA: phosphoribosylamine--glycine ligase [Candidatus Nitrosocosmicus sp.]|nr:phosphoribosylamine--glycine ligase [Candidatus Nitrosocosmicus sp.]
MHDNENVLIIGSGGREHALGWKISQNEHIQKIFYANGNGGTDNNLPILPTEFEKLIDFAKDNNCFTVVGPELPLSLGIVDIFESNSLKIFGPTKLASEIETSKEFSKNFMTKFAIPTSEYKVFTDASKAEEFIEKIDFNVVVKADGLAAGKGVFVTNSKSEAINTIDLLLKKKIFGKACEKIIVEKRIVGNEASIIAICDGNSFKLLDPCRDYKRAFDNDLGPNTGGMGSHSPVSDITENEIEFIVDKVFNPAIKGMNSEGRPFKGFLYAGLMIEKHTGKPYVLEFNARMGDPECQPLMMRMESDLLQYLEAGVNQSLDDVKPIEWKKKFSTCVIMTSKGYPDKYETGYAIKGITNLFDPDLMIFHSGTKRTNDDELVTSGGRVLGITSLGESLDDSINKAYQTVNNISWGHCQQQFRKDIGKNVT